MGSRKNTFNRFSRYDDTEPNGFNLFRKRYAGDNNPSIEDITKRFEEMLVQEKISELERKKTRNTTRSEGFAEKAKTATDANLAADYTKLSEMRKSRADSIATRIEDLKKRISSTSTTPGSTPSAPATSTTAPTTAA